MIATIGPGQPSQAERRRAPALLGGTAALMVGAWAMALSWSVRSPVWWQEIPPRLMGAVVIHAGVVAWLRLPSPRIGQLVVLGGAVYFLQFLRDAGGVLFAVGFCLAYAWIGITAHVMLAWPSARLHSSLDRIFVACAYVVSIGTQVIRYFVDHPQPPWDVFIRQPGSLWGSIGSAAGAAMGALGIALVVQRWLASAPVRRRPAGPVWMVIAMAGLVKIAEAVASVVSAPFELQVMLASLFAMTVIAMVPLLYLARWLNRRFAHQGVVRLLVDLERNLTSIADPAMLQQALSRSLGDPSLTLAYPSDTGGYVDIHGQQVTLADHATDHSVTRVRRRGQLIAVIHHDAALDEQRQVTDAAVAAAGLAIENARLYANLQAQLEQLSTSRLQLAQTAFDERLRIQRDLHDGAQQRFVRILVLLDTARRALAPGGYTSPDAEHAVLTAHSELTDALRALRDLIQGIYPAVLIEHGLAAAVENLADRAPIPVTFSVTDRRWPKHVEITAYFVISEALANIYKHARANHATVEVRADGRELVAEITDDGRGGALVGDGLRGLRHRLEAVGGNLRITSEPGQGTTLLAAIPEEHTRRDEPRAGVNA